MITVDGMAGCRSDLTQDVTNLCRQRAMDVPGDHPDRTRIIL